MADIDACVLCNSAEDNEIKFGKLHRSEGVSAHLYCLLFAPGLPQSGEDNEGIQGFLIEDIVAEAKRVRVLFCCFCDNKHANLGCTQKSCWRAFHIDCAFESSVSFEFDDPYSTFCEKHSKTTKNGPKSTVTCGICMEGLKGNKRSIKVPCCKNWFHHECLQHCANTSGSLFKCPLCNDREKCAEKLPKLGIFLPIKDADWELFDHLEQLVEEPTLVRICDSRNCRSDETFHDSPWHWKICSTCGSSAIHIACMSKSSTRSDFVCETCEEILQKPKVLREVQMNEQRSQEVESQNDDNNQKELIKSKTERSLSKNSQSRRPKRRRQGEIEDLVEIDSDGEDLENIKKRKLRPRNLKATTSKAIIPKISNRRPLRSNKMI